MNRIAQLSTVRTQRGASFIATMLIVALIGMMLVAALKVAPAYMDNNVIMNAVEGVISNNEMPGLTVNETRQQVMRTLNVNNIEFDSSNIQYVTESGVDYIDINYESRVHIFYNIDAVVTFRNRVQRSP